MRKLFLIILLLATFNLNAQLVTTFSGSAGQAGYVDGSSTTSRYNSPYGIATDKIGNVYIADRLNNRIRKIDALGNATTYAGSGVIGSTDGPALSATFIIINCCGIKQSLSLGGILKRKKSISK